MTSDNALARILFYVTSVRIRVFMRTLESYLVLQLFVAIVITLDMSRLVPATLILSILCSSKVIFVHWPTTLTHV